MPKRTFNHQGATLHVHVRGRGRPVVLVHGLSGSSHWWRRNIPALARHHQVFVLDLAGYGRAWRQQALGVQAAAHLIAAWLDHENLRDVTLIGHSMGGHISLRAAALRPERVQGLILACASGLLKSTLPRAALNLPRAALAGRPSFVPRILADALRAGPRNLVLNARDLLRDSVQDLLPQLQVKTLVIWGEWDALVPASLGRMLAAAIPGAAYQEVPRAGHVVMVDAPEAFNRLVLDFLRDLEGQPPLSPASGHAQFTLVRGLWSHAWVRGSGPPVVIVPGLGCASWMYLRLSRELAKSRTVYVYDPPGHGHSQGRAEYPRVIEDLTDHLAEWLKATGLDCAPLLGHSLGGEVIFDLAARYPTCVTALIACAPTGIPENPRMPVQLLRLGRDVLLERPGLWWLALGAYLRSGPRLMLKIAQDQSRHDTGPLLPHIHVPTLLLDGRDDPVIETWTVEALCAAVPHAIVREIPGAPHALTDSHPRAVARLVLDFLKMNNA